MVELRYFSSRRNSVSNGPELLLCAAVCYYCYCCVQSLHADLARPGRALLRWAVQCASAQLARWRPGAAAALRGPC